MIHHVFLVIAVVLGYVVVATHWWILAWLAAVFGAAWLVYLGSAPRAFMKANDGRQPWYAWLVWAPIFIWQWIAHEFVRAFSKEPVANEVAPGVWVGRRPRANELAADIAIVVDLCAELPAAPGVATSRIYLNIPTLDARAPTPEQIASAVDRVIATTGPALIHCAFGTRSVGHGRGCGARSPRRCHARQRRGEDEGDPTGHRPQRESAPRTSRCLDVGLGSHRRLTGMA